MPHLRKRLGNQYHYAADTLFWILAACLALLPACTHHSTGRKAASKFALAGRSLFDEDAARELLAAAFPGADSTGSAVTAVNAVPYIYSHAGYQPIWVAPDGLTEEAVQLLADLDSLPNDGIDPAPLGLDVLKASFEKMKDGASLPEVVAFDTACTHAYLDASRSLLFGVLKPRKADSLWFHSNDSSWNAPGLLLSLAAGKGYPSLDSFRSRIPLYGMLRASYIRWKMLASDSASYNLDLSRLSDSALILLAAQLVPSFETVAADTMPAGARARLAVARFLGRSVKKASAPLRISADTVARRMAANMERLRWLPRRLEDRFLLVNVPQMKLFFWEDGRDRLDMRVVVGRPSRQTPALDARLSSIILSPSWGVPPTIMKKDVLPGISKSGSHYLKRKGLRVFDRKGRPVDAGAINEHNYRKFLLRQPPGERNALGEIKFNLPNRWDIYLHDTPHRSDFERDYRAKSSGCIRLQKPHELAGMLLRDVEGRERFSPGRIDSIIRTRKTRSLAMDHKIPVHIVYLTVTWPVDEGALQLMPDIYHRDEKLMRLLAAHS
jgi:murein L,D-transpeptidase YcbB/YkuD